MNRPSKGMKYRKATAGSNRGISAGQWNGFLQMHKDYYGGIASNAPLPPLLQNSVIASAILEEDADSIPPYSPVRIVKQINFNDPLISMPSYVVEPVDATDENGDPTERHGNYGFTLGEGCTSEGGGRIVVSGIALVQMDAQELYYDKTDTVREGSFDSSYYLVPDNTLSGDSRLIGPAGHFKIVSWYDPSDVGKFERDDKVYIAVDMEENPESFRVNTATDIQGAAKGNDGEVITCQSTTGYTYFANQEPQASQGDFEIVREESKYEITVYNILTDTITSGDHIASYSKEYNKFVVLAASAGGGGGTAYMVETGNSSLIGGIPRELEIFEAPSAGAAPAGTGNTISVIHDWQTDMGSLIPSGVRLTVLECSDGYSRPIYVDNNWIYNTTLTQIFGDNVKVSASSINNTFSLFSIEAMRVYGYGIGRSGTASSFNILRTGTYTLSVQWDSYNHVENSVIRISDQTVPLTSQAFGSGQDGQAGYMVWQNYVVNQSMLNGGGAGFVVEHSYAGSTAPNTRSSWDNLTISLERVGD